MPIALIMKVFFLLAFYLINKAQTQITHNIAAASLWFGYVHSKQPRERGKAKEKKAAEHGRHVVLLGLAAERQ